MEKKLTTTSLVLFSAWPHTDHQALGKRTILTFPHSDNACPATSQKLTWRVLKWKRFNSSVH